MQVIAENIAKSFGINTIFSDINFKISKGEKIGLVGVNGSGKTTLLRILLDPSYADSGLIRFDTGLKVGYVEQGFGAIKDETIWEFMLRACPEILVLREKLERLEETISSGNEEVLNDYGKATARYEHLDGYNYEITIKKVLLGLAFPEDMWQDNALNLSGGQKTRLMLASALVSSPDFLILDEPTNHLDIKMMEWLEGYLRDYKGGLILVSHDRAFLDNVTTRILEMEKGKLKSFPGNYTKYLVQKEIQTKTQEAAYNAQQEYIADTEAYIRKFKAGIKSKMARGRQSQLDRLERIDAPVYNEEFNLRLPPAPESGEKVLSIEYLTVGYGEKVLAKDITLEVRKGEKIALLGANGTGKTTLLRTILGETDSISGRSKLGSRVQVGYFSQSYERLNPKQTLLDNFLTEYGFTEERTRSMLGGMLFHGDDVFKEIGTLSGGQKARLVLLKLVLDGANFLVLDEPTNHLDILAKETVEAALALFDGTILVVSHDRYLVNDIADRIWEIEDKKIYDYKGDYDYYLNEKSKRSQVGVNNKNIEQKVEKKIVEKVTTDTTSKKAAQRKYSPQELAKLLGKIELSIREQEAMKSILEREMEDPNNHLDAENSVRMAAEHKVFEDKLAELMEKWELLMEAQESLNE